MPIAALGNGAVRSCIGTLAWLMPHCSRHAVCRGFHRVPWRTVMDAGVQWRPHPGGARLVNAVQFMVFPGPGTWRTGSPGSGSSVGKKTWKCYHRHMRRITQQHDAQYGVSRTTEWQVLSVSPSHSVLSTNMPQHAFYMLLVLALTYQNRRPPGYLQQTRLGLFLAPAVLVSYR